MWSWSCKASKVSQSRAFQASSNAYILSKFVSGDNRRGLPTPSKVDVAIFIDVGSPFRSMDRSWCSWLLLEYQLNRNASIFNENSTNRGWFVKRLLQEVGFRM